MYTPSPGLSTDIVLNLEGSVHKVYILGAVKHKLSVARTQWKNNTGTNSLPRCRPQMKSSIGMAKMSDGTAT